MSDALLDAAFLRRLELLRRRLSARVQSGEAGTTSAPRRGSGAEFREHRPYSAGDDPRRIDWMAYARSGEPVIKLFRAEEDRIVRLLVDGSASMGFGSPSKLERAQRLAAAIGYLALSSSERGQVLVARDSDKQRPLAESHAPRRGRRAFPSLCRELAAIRAHGTADLPRALDNLLLRSTTPGLLALISDFFDAGPLSSALTRARAAGHEVLLVQVLDPLDITPQLEGDALLEDSETGARLELTADPAALAAYARALGSLIDSLRSWSRQHGGVYVRSVNVDDFESCVERVVARAID